MSTTELTPWFPPELKPRRPGIYQRNYMWDPSYAYFDGQKWGFASFCVQKVKKPTRLDYSFEVLPWRGLAREPK